MTSLPDRSLTSLLQSARAGDRQAQNLLFERCRAYVAVVARAQIGSWLQAKVDASDLIQQSLLDAHRGLHEFQGGSEGEWLAWLKRIVHHNAADYVRRYGTDKRRAGLEVPLQRPSGDSQGWQRDPSDPGYSPSEIVSQREEALEVAEAVSRLPQDYQEVIILRNLQRLPFEDIATQMGRSRPATQMLWTRAIRRLQELVDA